VCNRIRKVVNGIVETKPKTQVSDRGGEVGNRVGKIATQTEVGEAGGEVIDWVVKVGFVLII
jgi:hypothetical protein